jgi:hypothetical protein
MWWKEMLAFVTTSDFALSERSQAQTQISHYLTSLWNLLRVPLGQGMQTPQHLIAGT